MQKAAILIILMVLILGFQNCGRLGNSGEASFQLNSSASSLQASPSGSTIPSNSVLFDLALNAWTLDPTQIALVNGSPAGFSSGVILLLFYNGAIYQENIHNNWWVWSSGSWVALTADPRL